MIKRLILLTSLMASIHAVSFASEADKAKQMKWSFDGMFGTFDRAAIQRGFQVYKEVCSACHGIHLVAFRNLEEVGFSKLEVKALATEYKVPDFNDDGEPIERNALPSDRIPPPFRNEKAARASNNGAFPPDQSLIVKARPDGANYLYSLLTGYSEPPAGVIVPAGQYYNRYFPGNFIAMTPPLHDKMVTYNDGTEATVEQMAKDVVNFLQWTAEPEMEHRKKIGFKTLLYLSIFTALFYLSKCRVWSKLK